MNNGAALLRQLIFDDADVIGATTRRSHLFQDQHANATAGRHQSDVEGIPCACGKMME